jgi:exonuclease SbcC
MRLHHLQITAIGPFAGTEDIDLDALAAGGLFLLEGPTGAGKSTVLDAIVFALYGQTASTESSSDRLRSHFAAPDATPQVVLELSVRGDRLRITRVPEHERPKKRGEGTTKEKARVHLERLESGSWVSVSSSHQEVGHVLEDSLGLTREQFTKVVLLPQNEFATFLRSDDDTRRKLLTKVFGTALFDRVTDELDRRRKEAAAERDAAALEVATALAQAAEAAGLDVDGAAALRGLPAVERPQALALVSHGLAEAATDAEQSHAGASAALAAAGDALAAADAHVALLDDAVRTRSAMEAHLAARPQHEQRQAELRDGRAAAPVAVLLDQLDAASLEHDSALRALLDAVPDADDAARRGEGAHLRAAAAREADEQAAGLGHLVDQEAELEAAVAHVDALHAAADEAGVQRAEVEHDLALLPERMKAANERLDAAKLLAAGVSAAEQDVVRLKAQAEAAVALLRLEPRELQAQRDAQEAHEEWNRLHEKANALHSRYLDGIAANLAAVLVSGEPCLVCGGVDHPHPASTASAAITQDDVTDARNESDLAQKRYHDAQAKAADLKTQRADLQARAGDLDPAELTAVLDARAADLEAGRAAQESLPRLADELEELALSAGRLEARLQAAREEEARRTAEHRAALDALGARQREIESAREGHPSVAARQQSLRTLAEAERRTADLLTAVAAARSALEQRTRQARTAASKAGFADLDAVRLARRTDEQLEALDAACRSWEAELAALTASAQDARFLGLDLATADDVRARAAEQRRILDQADASHRAAMRDLAVATQRVERFADACLQVAAAQSRHDDAAAEAAPVERLARLARGMGGERRMTLTSYVLRRWFEQVVDAANLRLAAMSAGRYELERTDDAERRAERSGLSLRVIDRHTGEARNPRSLSGGETFYTSLALALGLADVVKAEAGGVDLDTLFIDEGFGSLDPETLEQVMAVIDDLRDGGRAIGIVSHVAELKDRIPERLEVSRPRPQGPSTTRVVA